MMMMMMMMMMKRKKKWMMKRGELSYGEAGDGSAARVLLHHAGRRES